MMDPRATEALGQDEVRFRRWRGWLFVGVLALHLAGVALLFTPFRYRTGIGSVELGLDVPAIHAAGLRARQGRRIYWPSRKHKEDAPPPFRYLPASAYTLAAALSLLPERAAAVVWFLVVEVLLLINATLVFRLARSLLALAVGLACWLLAPPAWVDLWFGQFSAASASLAFWAALAWGLHRAKARRPETRSAWLGAAWWAGAVLVKNLPLVYLGWLWKRRELRWPVAAAVGLTLGASALYFLLRPADFSLFMRFNADPANAWLSPWNSGLWSAVETALAPRTSPLVRRALGGGWTLAIVAAAGAATWRASEEQGAWLLGLWTCVFLLTFKEVWDHTYVYLAPFLALAALARGGRPFSRALWAATGLMAWINWPNPFVTLDGKAYTSLLPGLLWKPLPTLMLFLLCLCVCWIRSEEGPQEANGSP